LFLTAESNFRRVGISDLQKSQVTSLRKTKFDSLELLRSGELDLFFQRRADLNSATPMSSHPLPTAYRTLSSKASLETLNMYFNRARNLIWKSDINYTTTSETDLESTSF